MKKKVTILAFALIMCTNVGTTAFATSNDVVPYDSTAKLPVVDDSKDFSTSGKVTYTYEGDYYVQSYEATTEEIQLSQMLQQLHTHPSITKHFSLSPHTHSIKDIKTGTAKSYIWRPTEMWTRNDRYSDSNDWPTVAWETNQSTSASISVTTSVGVTDSVVSTSVGTDYTKSHTIGTSTTRTFKVPYQKDGRIKVTFDRPYKTFTCVSTYILAGPPVTSWTETGAGNAQGKPTNIVCNIETRSY